MAIYRADTEAAQVQVRKAAKTDQTRAYWIANFTKCQSRRDTLEEIYARGFDLTEEIIKAKELKADARALASDDDDDDDESKSGSESGEELDGEETASRRKSGTLGFFLFLIFLCRVLIGHCKYSYLMRVVVAKKHKELETFFAIVTNVLNVTGLSFKRRDQLREHQEKLLEQLLESGEVQSDVNDKLQAKAFSSKIKAFEFIFLLHLMLKVLIMSNEFSKALQKKEQDIVNAMVFLDITKERLQEMRDGGWEPLIDEVSSFCANYYILVPKMEEFYIPGKSTRRPSSVTYSHHLRAELFYAVIDLQFLELNSHFDVVSNNLLLGMATLNPANSFANFDKERIMTLAKHYPDEFGELKFRDLSRQLDTFIWNMQHGDPRFSDLKGIGDLAKALVEENLVETYSLVYLLVKLTLILHVTTATVEGAFLSVKYIKDELRSNIIDAFLYDCLVCYFEKEVFVNISNDAIIDRFQNMKARRVKL
ncbi:uncharacterized protein [Nicotiana tomentosiformis]|uniref:uncharacterized protein n=1 Tax=Nicotiana tomentosiformis TaxID=4098 RepID=UPI00388CCC3D